MVSASRTRFLLVLLGFGALALGPAAPAWSQQPEEDQPVCHATGYLVESREELTRLRQELAEQPVHQRQGVPLRSGQTWALPDGFQPVVVIDSTAPLSGGTVSLSFAGQSYQAATSASTQPTDQYVTNVYLPHLGPVVRSLGMTVASGPCEVAVTLSVQKRVWFTVAGGLGLAVAVVFGLLTVLVARLRKGGWLRRFLFAAPLGLIAGTGQAVLLLEAGVFGPFAPPPWWLPLAGVAVAALLPLTRWRRRSTQRGVVPAAEPATVGFPPAQAPLGGYRIVDAVARTEVAGIYHAVREPGGERGLLKVALPERYGEPGVRLRLEREARVLAGLEHPHILRLRATLTPVRPPADPDQTVADGPTAVVPAPPTLVFEDVDGAPLRRLLAGGALTGPQVVTVVLGVLAGLEQLHAQELVHRDVRPENVWLGNDGRVLLSGFEVACPGVEHPVAPEGTTPYASPEQRARQPLDRRSDLYSSGVLLGELLTGVPPAGAGGVPGGLPEPLAAVLARALAEEPGARPESARQLAEELREAAGEAFGADWVGRGALAGALVVHGGIAAGVTGYTLGGGAAGAGIAGAGVAGAGSAGAVGGLGSAAGAGAAAPAVAAATTQTGGQAVGQAATTGPVGTLVNAAVAVVAAVGVVVGAVVADPDPTEARQAVVITPEQARIIFVRTMAEGLAETFTHFAEEPQAIVEYLVSLDDSVAGGQLTEVAVGVPPEQYQHPAWFVASGLIRYQEGTISLFARFDRAADDEPWLLSTLDWSLDRLLPAPLVDQGGWLAPAPAVGDLLVDPASLPERYVDWLERAANAGEVGSDELLALRFEVGLIQELGEQPLRYSGDNPETVRTEYEMSTDGEVTEPLPLADGTAYVSFTATASYTTVHRPAYRDEVCDDIWLIWHDGPSGRFRRATADMVVTVDAWIPVPSQVPDPPATPSPEPSPDPEAEPDPDAPLEPEPVDPETVVIEDWQWTQENAGGERC